MPPTFTYLQTVCLRTAIVLGPSPQKRKEWRRGGDSHRPPIRLDTNFNLLRPGFWRVSGTYPVSESLAMAVSDTASLASKVLFWAGLAPTPEDSEAMKKMFESLVLLGRIARPEEVAASAVYLASEDSSYVTGGDLSNDGGASQ